MTKNCLSCNTKFNGRKDAKTCSVACRKRLQRAKNAILHEAGVIKQDIAQVVDTLRGEIIPVKLTPSLALAETEAEPETDSTSLQDSSWEPPYLDLPSAASFASGPAVTPSVMPLAGSSPVTRPAPATLATPAPLSPPISTPTPKPAIISEPPILTNEQLARTVTQPPAPAVEPTILSLETKASQASAPALPISAMVTASATVPAAAVPSPISPPPSPAAFNFPSPPSFDLRNRLLPLLRRPPLTAALGALMLVVIISGVFASSKLFNQSPKSTPVASTQTDQSLTEEGGILSLNLDTVVAKGKTFTVGQIIAGPDATVLQVTGDVQSNGTLLASNGQTSLNNTGLKINDVVVCTATGCKTGTTVTLASTLTGQVSLINLPSEVTIQGNSFNSANQLVQLTSGGLLPILSGANLTNLNATNIASGSLADARLSANVALLNGSALFKNTADSTTAFRIQNAAGTNLVVVDTVASTVTVVGLQGSGANLTSLNASNISSGTLADGRLSTNVSLLGQTIDTNEITNATIVNVDISGTAAIDYTKLNLTGNIVNADISPTAAIAYSKLNLAGLVVSADITDGTIVNADINVAAAIDWTKVNKTGSSFADFTTRSASDISSGTLAIARGGTGAGTAQAAIDNLSGLTTTGDLLYYDGANSSRFARGANATCLQSTAATINWVACAGLTTLQNAYDNGNTITTSDARNLTLTFADTATDSNLTLSTATGSSGFTTISRADGAGVADPAQLLLIDNLDLDRAQPIGLKLQSAAGALTTAIDVSDPEIVTALAIGSNTITTTTTTIAATELDLLDGHDVALVDTNDAVATAIIGTGALNAGSITSGFGTIDNADTITGTTLNATTGINTGAGAGTQRIDSSGNLVNIGNLTATGAITIASAGAGNDIIINGADILDVQDATTFATTATFNGVSTFNTDVDLTLAGTENVALTSDLAGTVNVVSLVATPSASVGTTRGFFIQQADSINGNGLDQALYIDNADTNLAIPAAISIQNSGGGGYTTIIDNAGTLISGAELNLLDGHDVALVDTNDAVATAITGTGALAAGSLAAGFTTVAVGQGGTGATTFTANGVLYGNTTAAIGVTAAGTTGQCLTGATGAAPAWTTCTGLITLQNAYDNGNTITTSDARNLTLTFADTATDSNLTLSTATGSSGFTTISRADGAGVADPAQLLLIDNLDLDRAQPIGLKLQSAAGALTTAIDVSDPEIVTALAIGSNTITTTTTTIAATELDLLDGHDVALVDTNDAVATAIIGTGALNAGSITSGFGTIDNADTITGTTLNGTTGINTGAGAGTQRIDLSGNLVNIGNLTATGAITIASAGAGNDVIINGADILDIQDATTFASTATFNGVSTFNTDVDLTLAGTENVALTSDLAGSVNVVSLIATPSASAGTTRGFFIQQADSINGNGLDQALYIDNADTNLAIPAAISIQNSGGGGYTTIIDNAGTLISGAELNRLDGKDAALVDTNDAVATAITGTGALAAGSLAAGFTTVAVGQGGTGATTFTANGVLYGNTTAAVGVTAAGTTGQCLTGATGAAPAWTTCTGLVTLQNAYDNGNTITTSDARNLTLTFADTATDSNLTLSTATGSSGFTTISRADGAGVADPAQLLLIDNLDLDRAQPIGLKLQSAAGALTTAIDVSDPEIVTALAIGSNTITTTTTTIAATELDLLDGRSGTLVDSANVATYATTGVTAGTGLTGGGTVGVLTLNVASANGGIVANADNIALTLQPSADALSVTTSSGSGLEILTAGVTLLQGCANNEILKWVEATDVWNCAADGGGGGTLQAAYDGDTDTGDTIIALTAADDSLIFRNPAAAGSDSTYILTLDNLATTATGGLSIQSAGSGNLLLVTDTTATARDVLTIANGGATTFRNQTDSTAGFSVQNAAGTSNLVVADTTNTKLGIATAPSSTGATVQVTGNVSATTGLVLGATGNSASTITKSTVVTTTVTANDVVIIDTSNAAQVTTTSTYGATGVFGIATSTQGSTGQTQNIVIGGIYQVTADTAAVAIGDQLVTSSTTGQVTPLSNPSIGTSIGRALSSKASGSSGTVWVQVTPGAGGSSGSGGMTKLYDTTLGASAASFDIQNIPSGYDNLKVVTHLRSADDGFGSTGRGWLRFNNDSGANQYTGEFHESSNGTAGAGNVALDTKMFAVGYTGSTTLANVFAVGEISIPNYTSAYLKTAFSHMAGLNTTTFSAISRETFESGTWNSTAAINRVTVLPQSGNFAAGSRVTVYGIGPNSGGTAAGAGGGEMVYTQFTSNVSITATTEATANTIVTGSSYTYDGNTPVVIQFFTPAAYNGSTGDLYFVLYEDGSSIGKIGEVYSTGTALPPVKLERRLTPTSGSHTYSIRAFDADASATVYGGAGGSGNYVPGFIRITPANGAGNATTLQGAYDMGRAITTTDARDIDITLANTTTDSNFLIDIDTSSTSKFAVQYANTDTFSISNTASAQGSALFRNGANNTTAFQIQNATGADTLFVANTTNNRIVIGNATAAAGADTTILVLDSATTANAPTGVNGGMFYDTTLNKFRCYENSAYTNCVSAGTVTNLQTAYDGDADGSDSIIALTTADDSLIFRNPAAAGSDSTYILTLDNLATTATGGLSIQSAGSGNLLLVTDTTATARDVLTIANGGATTFRNQTDSTTAFQVQNAAGTSNLVVADTTNTKLGIAMTPSSTGATVQITGNASATTGLVLAATGNSSSTIAKSTVVTTAVTANDVVIIDTSNAAQVTTTSTYGATGVFGIATSTQGSIGQTQNIVIGGVYQVTADTAAVAIGDQLVTSSTTGQVTPLSNPSIGTSIGRALSSKASGSSGAVWVQVTPGAGGSSGSGGLTKLYDTTLGAAAASMDIQNIPAGYDSIKVAYSVKTSQAATTDLKIVVNNDTAANYRSHIFRSYNAVDENADTFAATYIGSGYAFIPGSTAGANAFASGELSLSEYTSTTKYKEYQLFHEAGDNVTYTIPTWNVGTWKNTAAINRLTFSMSAGNVEAGSRVIVYGVGPNSGGTAAGAGGGEIGYTEFTSSVTITGTSEAAATTVVTAPAYTFDGNTPVLIECFSPYISSQQWETVTTYLYDGSSSIGFLTQQIIDGSVGPAYKLPWTASRRITPSAASHTYSCRASITNAGITTKLEAGLGGNGVLMPGYIRITPAKGAGNATTLQGAYDMGRAITTTDARDISITLANTTTDSNFLVNVASSSTSKFALQNNGADAFSLSSTGDSANLLTNGSIEVDTTGWSARGSATLSRTTSSPTPYLGLGQLKVVTTAAANDGAKYAFALASTTQYTLTAFAHLDSGSAAMATFQMGRADDGITDTSCLTAQTLVTTGWTRFSCTFTTGTTSGSPYVYFKQTDAAVHTYYLDAVKLETGASATSYKEGGFALNGTITSPTTFKNGSDSTAALAIQNSSGTNLFVVDTLNSLITLKTASATPLVLVLSDKNTAGDPATCTNGGLYYNSNSSNIRACIAGAWESLPGVLTNITSAVTVVSTVTETNLINYTIPAGAIGTDKTIRATIRAHGLNNTGVDHYPRLRVYIGVTKVYEDDISWWTWTSNASRRPVPIEVEVQATGATNSQFTRGSKPLAGTPGSGASVGYIVRSSSTDIFTSAGRTAVDMSSAQALRVSIEFDTASAGLEMKMESASVTIE